MTGFLSIIHQGLFRLQYICLTGGMLVQVNRITAISISISYSLFLMWRAQPTCHAVFSLKGTIQQQALPPTPLYSNSSARSRFIWKLGVFQTMLCAKIVWYISYACYCLPADTVPHVRQVAPRLILPFLYHSSSPLFLLPLLPLYLPLLPHASPSSLLYLPPSLLYLSLLLVPPPPPPSPRSEPLILLLNTSYLVVSGYMGIPEN